jgi:2-succinyl-5-enolpyruvyl-6-hydroxy-3-cyclohexene-1-carboxylate synthase
MTKILIAIAIFAAILVAVTLWQGDQYKAFMKTAQKTTAKIVAKDERVADPKTKRKEYWVTYSFDVADTHYTSQEQLEYIDIWQALRMSYPADIYYNRRQPSECHLASALDRRLGIVHKLGK